MIPVLIVMTSWTSGSVGPAPAGGHIPGSVALAHLGSRMERSAPSGQADQQATPQGRRDCTPEVFGRIYARSAAVNPCALQHGRPPPAKRVT
jgi:hypothetical protein